MTKEQLKTTAEAHVADAVDKLQDDYNMEHRSDAVRHLTKHALGELGYLGDGVGVTPARRIAREVAKLLAYVAGTLIVLSSLAGGEYLELGVATSVCASLVLLGDWLVLRRIEPAVTNVLPQIEVSRRGAQ